MKKLSLNKLKLDADDLLKKEQLKTIFGGYGYGGNGGSYKCCWDDYPNDCSKCYDHSTTNCTAGAHAVAC